MLQKPQKWYEAMNAAEDQLDLPKNTLIDPNTGMDLKKSATNLLKLPLIKLEKLLEVVMTLLVVLSVLCRVLTSILKR